MLITGEVRMADQNINRKKTEEDIRNQINLFKNVISNIPHAIFWKDLNSIYFGCNENFAKIAGLRKAEDIFGKSDRDLPWKKDEADAFVTDDRRVMASGMPILNIEESQRQADGREAVILISKVPLRDSNGQVIGLLGIYSDITERKNMEVMLQKERTELQMILDSSPSGIFYKDKENRFIRVNDALCKALGRSKKELEGKSAFDIYDRAQADAFWRDDKAVIDSGHSRLNIIEFVNSPKGGLWMHTDKIPYRDANGNIIGVIGFTADITERVKMEKTLTETANQWQATFDSSSDMIMLLDTEMRIVKANRASSEYLQMPTSEIVGRLCYHIFHADRKPTEICPLTSLREAKICRSAETIHIPERNMWIHISADAIQDKSGKITGYVHTMRDVTAQKNLEDEIRKSEIKFRTVFENSSGAIIIFDMKTGQVVECNSGAEKLIRRMRVQMIGMPYMDIHPKAETEEYVKIMDQHLDKGYPGDYEGEIEHEDGSRIPVLMRAQKMKMDDKDVAMVLLIDIADRKRGEVAIKKAYDELKMIQADLVQSEKMAAIGRFSAGIAHEVKNPLAVIVGCAELLQNKMPRYDLDAMDTLEKIKDAALRANSILVSLLQFARPSELKVEITDPRELIEGVLPLFEKRANETNIDITKNFSALEMRLSVDKNQIHQVIFNIIKNAMEAMPDGGKIIIRTHKMIVPELSYTNPSCVIELQDTGSGISKENMMKIAEPFFSTKARVAGTGLGLFMVKSILDKHKGKLLVASEMGRGTLIKIVLPIVKN